MSAYEETIAAVATPPGEGAIAMVRISGPDTKKILAGIFKTQSPHPKPRTASFGKILDGEDMVDQVLVTRFEAPASFTGEDMAEICCHGGVLLAAKILELVLRHGARAAEPGEFSQRAFFNAARAALPEPLATMSHVTAPALTFSLKSAMPV